MLTSLILIFIATLFSALLTWRQISEGHRFVYSLVAQGVLVLLQIGLIAAGVDPAGAGLYLFLALLTAGWIGLLWSSGFGFSQWGALLAVGLAFGAIVAPQMLIDFLSWGMVSALPLLAILMTRELAHANEDRFPIIDEAAVATAVLPHSVMTEERLATQYPVLEFLDSGVVVSDGNGNILFLNELASRLIGESADLIIGQPVMSILARLPMLSHDSMGSDPSQLSSLPQFEMNGRLIQGRMHVTYDEGNQVNGMVAILADITDAHQAERAKTAFLTTVSHELRTPLTAIQGYVELLGSETGGTLNPNQMLFVETIKRNVKRMVQLINSLIFVSAVKDGRVKAQGAYADVRQIVRQIVRELEPMIARQRINVELELSEDLAPIQADSIHVTTMLQELISNSIKYNESGGVITIKGQLQGEIDSDDAFVMVEVVDNGIGIDPADQLNIFDDFYRPDTQDGQIKAGGMGVGLSIVRALVEAYNGRIWLESSLGKGSTFTFILPVSQASDQLVAIPESSSLP